MDSSIGYEYKDKCKCCGRTLVHDEVALYKKLFNRGAKSFMCIDCTSRYLGVPISLLKEKIREFKAMGCTLFLPGENANV